MRARVSWCRPACTPQNSSARDRPGESAGALAKHRDRRRAVSREPRVLLQTRYSGSRRLNEREPSNAEVSVEEFDQAQFVVTVEKPFADLGHVLGPELLCPLAVVPLDETHETSVRSIGAATLFLLIVPPH